MTIDKPAWAAESYVDQRWLCHDLRMGEVMAARRDELTPDGMEPGELIIFVGPNGTEYTLAESEKLHADLTAVLYKAPAASLTTEPRLARDDPGRGSVLQHLTQVLGCSGSGVGAFCLYAIARRRETLAAEVTLMSEIEVRAYEYKFVRLGEYRFSGLFGPQDGARAGYQDVVREHARDGWRLVQIFAPGVAAFGAARYYELIFERETHEAAVAA